MGKKQLFFEHIGTEEFYRFAYYLVFDDLPENLSQEDIKERIADRLIELCDEDFIEYAYLLILLREADAGGKEHYSKMLRKKHPFEILDILSRSKEARNKSGLKFFLSWKDRLLLRFIPPYIKRKVGTEAKKQEDVATFVALKSQIESLRQHPKLFTPHLPQYHSRSITHLQDAKKETKRLFGHEAQDFYSLFESVFYNSGVVKEHQRYYLSYIIGPKVLDIGAGRGEFVELLLSHNFDAIGIDSNEDVVKYASSKELPIFHADALEFLQQSHQFDTITALEVVEHLDTEYLWKLLRQIFQVLAPGGRIIIETPNPLANTGIGIFYMDLTHQRPLPPQLLSFMLEFVGFCDLQIHFSSPVPPEYSTSFMDKNYQTYAVIGIKP